MITATQAWDYSFHGIDWATEGNENYNQNCAGRSQSPINIVRQDAILVPQNVLKPLRKACGDVVGKIKNNGHTLKFETSDGKPVVSNSSFMSGGPLEDSKYFFLQFHIHWGYWNCNGSEHTVDNNR